MAPPPTHEPQIHALWTNALLAFARGRGLDVEALRVRVGLDPALLEEPLALVPLMAHYETLEAVAVGLDDPDLGLALGQSLDEAALGALAFVSMTAKTFGEGLAEFGRNMPAGSERFELLTEGDAAHLRFHPFGPSRPAHHLRASSFAADIVANAVQMAGAPVERLEVRLRTADSARIKAAREALGVPVEGGAPLDEVRFAAAALELKTARADAAMHRFFGDYLRQRRGPDSGRFADRVGALIDAHLPDRPLDAASLADGLRVSARTLQRRLHSDGTSLRELLAQRRMLKAHAVLEAGGSVSEAAFEAGYSEASALHRALRRQRETST